MSACAWALAARGSPRTAASTRSLFDSLMTTRTVALPPGLGHRRGRHLERSRLGQSGFRGSLGLRLRHVQMRLLHGLGVADRGLLNWSRLGLGGEFGLGSLNGFDRR